LHKHHSALGLATVPAGNVRIAEIVKARPVQPVTLVRPHAAARAARFFVEKFPGRSMYAVKANPSPELLQILWDNGITHYDVASIAEVRLVARTLPEATLCFMHPVKAEEAIAEAYFTHGVRTFSLDSMEELDKVVAATNGATDLTLCVRLRVSSDLSKLSLASKFGAHAGREQGIADGHPPGRRCPGHLLPCRLARQCRPKPIRNAMERVRAAIVEAGRHCRRGRCRRRFPLELSGHGAAAARAATSRRSTAPSKACPISYSAELWAEPGRALCAEYSSLIVRVEKRRGDELYINDGAYGALFDAAHIGWRFPVRLLREPDSNRQATWTFSFYGPTCDDLDHMTGPFDLPADTSQAGDFIEIGMLGAYGSAMRTAFNGFGSDEIVVIDDEPMASLYVPATERPRHSNVVKL
jgi:ornithine decarboxylase